MSISDFSDSTPKTMYTGTSTYFQAQVDCVSLCICLLVSHRCVSLLVRVWALDVWGELVPSKIFNPPFQSSKLRGHSLVYVMFVGSGLMRWGSF